jgi:3-oxoacyl-[acyl-carrier protein] reductase
MKDDMADLIGKVAFVTGGSSGIGAASAKALAARGAHVVIGYNSGEQRARELMTSLPGDKHRTQQIVLERTDTIIAAAADVEKAYGRLDILVNSAGFTRPIPHGDLDTLEDALFDSIMTANVRGVFATIRAFAPLMRATRDAVVVNISSIAAFTGAGSNVAYCASKAALDTMTISLARVLGPEIRVLAVSPGAVATDFVAGRGREALDKAAQTTPLKRVVEPEDVADAVVACVTLLRTATGTRIVVDGGRHL